MKKIQLKKISALLLFLLSVPVMALAQINEGGDTAAKTAAEGAKPGDHVSWFEFLMKGGAFMIPILLLLFYVIYLIIERYRYIKRVTTFNQGLIGSIRGELSKGNIKDALNNVAHDQTSFGAVVTEGIMTVGRPVSEIESNMEKVVNIEIGKMEKGMGQLSMIASIAPIFGFIGTIAGVIKIFYNISTDGNISISTISGGLYEKMICSGAGLAVGLIAYAAYHGLNALIDKFVLRAQKVNLEFVNIIQRPS